MARFKDREKAVQLRKEGKSYSQIKEELKVSKSTLSVWLRRYPLTAAQMSLMRGRNETRIEKFRQTMRQKREKRLIHYYQEAKEKWLPLSERELFLAGLFLYWGEGTKANKSTVTISNTDPQMLQFALYWMINALKVPRENIKIALHLYQDMDVAKEIDFWGQILGISKSQFEKPYIKSSTKAGLTYKGFGHGTCGIKTHNTILKEKILMGLKAIADTY